MQHLYPGIMSCNPSFEIAPLFVVFQGQRRIAQGDRAAAAQAAWRAGDAAPSPLVLDRRTGLVVDLDLRGSAADVALRYAPAPDEVANTPARRGRPKLGVVPREVTLLPRHWDWLSAQPGGASAALRRLVEAAVRADGDATPRRARIEAAYRFMSTMAGDLPGFEEAARALYANDHEGLRDRIRAWPADIAEETLIILGEA